MSERHGTRPDTPDTEPAPAVTGKARSDEWVLDRRQGGPLLGPCHPGPRSERNPDYEPGGPPVSQGHDGAGVRVSEAEASILQSFPPDYPWQGSRSKQFQQIGNAVPPLLARAVLSALLEAQEARKAA